MINTSIIIISIISIIGTLLPESKSKHWLVRGQSNFRAVYLIVDIILLIILLTSTVGILFKIPLGIMLALSVYICLKSIAPYSPLFPKKVDDTIKFNNDQELSILVHNVYQFNDQYDNLAKMILDLDPDIILLLEINDDWERGLSQLNKSYKHAIKQVQENTYGIMLLSKIELNGAQVNNLVYKDIPSVEALFQKNGRAIRIIGLHPEPPIPGEVLTSVPKEKEMLSAADKINNINDEFEDNELTIVIGDLNDVAWSRIAQKFKKLTGLVDPRVGRGFYSTFPTYSPIKIPLDHVFCSPSFKLIQFDTLDAMGSDHKSILVRFKIPD